MPAILPAVFIPFQIGFLALYAPNAPAPVANSGNKLSACWTPVSAARTVVKRGRVMFEIAGVEESIAREAFRKAHHKLPVKTKFISKEESY